MRTVTLALLVGAALVGGGMTAVGVASPPDVLPASPDDPSWSRPVVRPDDLRFDLAMARAASLPRLRSLLVSVDGHLAFEQYFHGADVDKFANLKSASKSIVALLVGIAIDQGFIPSPDAPIGDFFPDLLAGDPVRGSITVEDLLTMRAGLETTSNRNYGRWVSSGNWVRFALGQPLVADPGGPMIYSTGSTHLLSAILTRATGRSTLAFARDELAQPLGIDLPPWTRDPQGIFLGGNEMRMRPRDMLAVGELVLTGGRHAGRQVIPESWLEASIVPRTRSSFSRNAYGYGWWMRTLGGHAVHYAWGYGGQFIFVVPDARTVVVTTSDPLPGDGRRQHLQRVYEMVEEAILPVAAQVGRTGASGALGAPGASGASGASGA